MICRSDLFQAEAGPVPRGTGPIVISARARARRCCHRRPAEVDCCRSSSVGVFHVERAVRTFSILSSTQDGEGRRRSSMRGGCPRKRRRTRTPAAPTNSGSRPLSVVPGTQRSSERRRSSSLGRRLCMPWSAARDGRRMTEREGRYGKRSSRGLDPTSGRSMARRRHGGRLRSLRESMFHVERIVSGVRPLSVPRLAGAAERIATARVSAVRVGTPVHPGDAARRVHH